MRLSALAAGCQVHRAPHGFPRGSSSRAVTRPAMGGRYTKSDAEGGVPPSAASSNPSAASAAEGLEGAVLEKLTLSMREARVVCRRPSQINGDILIEELLDDHDSATTIRRMRFCSNLALEQTEVRLFRWSRLVPKKHRGAAGQGSFGPTARGSTLNGENPFQALERIPESAGQEPASTEEAGAGGDSSSEEEVEVLVADSNYLPYECMQGMCLSLALLPRTRVDEVWQDPLSVCITGLAGGMLPRFLRHNLPKASIDCVEIDPAVAEVAKDMLGLKPDGALRVHVCDGVDFMAAADDAMYDLNIIDVNAAEEDKTLEAPPEAFVTAEFLNNFARVTKPGGLAVVTVQCSSQVYAMCILCMDVYGYIHIRSTSCAPPRK